MRSLANQIKVNQRREEVREETDNGLASQSLVDMVSYPYPMRRQEKLSGEDRPSQVGYDAAENGSLTFIRPARANRPDRRS